MHESRPAPLRHIVESIWEVEGIVEHTRARHFPSGAIELLVNLGAPQRLVSTRGVGVFANGAAWLAGLQARPVVVDSEPGVHLFGVRLRAAAAATVLGLPMGLSAERVIHLGELGRPACRAVAGDLAAARTFAARLRIVCRWLEQQYGPLHRPPNYVEWIAGRIEASNGITPIGPLRRAARVSAKRLAHDFALDVGMTPKLLARVHRFRHARTIIQQPGCSLVETAAACGYFDQAHMSNEFRDLGGVTPGGYLASCYPDGNSGVIEAS